MKIIKKTALALALILSAVSNAQVTESFDTFTLTPNSFYQDNNGTDWKSSATKPVTFEYGWENNAWSSGSVYTNIKDTTNVTSSNLYGAVTFTAYDGTNYATVKDSAIIYLDHTTTFLSQVSGFFITNTTYMYDVIKNGNATCRKFGDTTGTGEGANMLQGEYPDWLRLTVYGYFNGIQNPTYAQFYLADYRGVTSTDYIVKNWRYMNCSAIGIVDSLQLILESSDSDTTTGVMHTPGYFSIDRFTVTNNVGVRELENVVNINISPNPTNQNLTLSYALLSESTININVFDISGKEVITDKSQGEIGSQQLQINTEQLEAGIYFLNISNGTSSKKIKFIKL